MRGFLTVCALLLATAAPAQPPPSLLTGRVLAAAGDAPLRRARVLVSEGRRQFDPILTDDEGRFAVGLAGTGPFSVAIEKAGYVAARTTVARDDLGAGLLVRLPRGAAISGVVVDQNGRRAPFQPVALTSEGEPVSRSAFGSTTTADELGEFRIGGLAAGRYEVRAGVPQSLVLTMGPSVETSAGVTTASTPVMRLSGADPERLGTPQVVALDSGDEVAVELSVTTSSTSLLIAEQLAVGGVLAAAPPSGPRVPGSATVAGRVTDQSGAAIAGASVRLVGLGLARPVRVTEDGRFSFPNVPPGQYTLEASAPGYPAQRHGQRGVNDPGVPFEVAADQAIDGIEMALRQGAGVSGFVVDEHGEPIQGAAVRALQVQYRAGRATAVPLAMERRTDDRGYYRLSGILPGSYVVSATIDGRVAAASGAAHVSYAETYYPGVTSIGGAMPVDVVSDVSADFTLVPAAGGTIRGRARDGAGPLVAGTARLVESRRFGMLSVGPRPAPIQQDGTFAFSNVAPGEYVVQVLGDGPGRTGLFGVELITVSGSGEPVDVTIATAHGATLEGRITFEGRPDPALCTATPAVCQQSPNGSFSVAPIALDDRARSAGSGSSFVVAGSTFYISGLFGLTGFALQRSPSDEWFLESLTVNGIDVSDSGFEFAPGETIDNAELVLSRDGAAITGSAAAGDSHVTDFVVVVFPAFRDQWLLPQSRRMKLTRARRDGSFRVGGLPAGDYFVAAVDRLDGTTDGGEWQNPAVLDQLAARAERVTLSDGQTRELTLRLLTR